MKTILKKLFSQSKIKKRLLVYFLLVTLLMGIANIYTYYNARTFMNKMNVMFDSNVYLSKMQNDVNMVIVYLEKYLSTKHSESLRQYIRYCEELKKVKTKMKNNMGAAENNLLISDISNMIDSYLVETDAAVNSKRGRNINDYIMHYTEANKIAGYINLYINRLNTDQLRQNTERYASVVKKLNIAQVFNIVIFSGAVLFSLILILLFTNNITEPIIKLSRSANEISKGNFDVDQVIVDSNDEIGIMANAFNRMTLNIKKYINEIKQKAKLEGRLKEQEMQNLIMKNLLKEAELQALQSQINPHFLFNTLNAGAQIAMLEGADRTCTFMENVANLFRYNIRSMDEPVTLRKEIDNIDNYVYILKARFGDGIEFHKEISESIEEEDLDVKMPCMVLQPLVENAFIHGISDMETGGRIALAVTKNGGTIKVVVEDNGEGMSEEKVRSIMEGIQDMDEPHPHIKKGHTTGIGLTNVIERLKLFFSRDNVLEIFSRPSKGTKITINIPVNLEGGDNSVQASNS